MKRRLSILLSSVGDPKVVFLDEPTTGLDPVNRRFIWGMINKMKKQRAMVLTTHSMEEADYLSDRIGIMKEGEFKCLGTAVELKNLYSNGFLLSFICENEHVNKTLSLIKKVLPSSILVNSSGGSIIMNLDCKKYDQLKLFFNFINKNYSTKELVELKDLVKETGITHTTLEEVFLKITQNKNVFAHADEFYIGNRL